jgi:hypothetical protein
MNVSFDTLSSFLTLIGLQTDNDFLCKHESDYVSQKLNEFFESKSGNVNTDELIEYAKTIVSDIEQVLDHIRSTEWFRYSKDIILDMNESHKYNVSCDATIDMNQFGRNIIMSLSDFVKTKEFAFYNQEYIVREIVECFENAPHIFPINFDDYMKRFMRKHKADDYDDVEPKRVKLDNIRSNWV